MWFYDERAKRAKGGINIRNKIIFLGIIIIFLITIHTSSSAKYIFNNQFEIADLNIDRTKPKIEVIDIQNTNKGHVIYHFLLT